MNPSGPLLDEATRGDEVGQATRAHVGGIAFVPRHKGLDYGVNGRRYPQERVRIAPRLPRRYDSLEECDDGSCEDIVPITGDHVGGVGHVHILGVRALLQETLGPRLT
jgi:hypothetical protein